MWCVCVAVVTYFRSQISRNTVAVLMTLHVSGSPNVNENVIIYCEVADVVVGEMIRPYV